MAVHCYRRAHLASIRLVIAATRGIRCEARFQLKGPATGRRPIAGSGRWDGTSANYAALHELAVRTQLVTARSAWIEYKSENDLKVIPDGETMLVKQFRIDRRSATPR